MYVTYSKVRLLICLEIHIVFVSVGSKRSEMRSEMRMLWTYRLGNSYRSCQLRVCVWRAGWVYPHVIPACVSSSGSIALLCCACGSGLRSPCDSAKRFVSCTYFSMCLMFFRVPSRCVPTSVACPMANFSARRCFLYALQFFR